ncbi:MAG: glycosyltransferase family 2 protein [Bdellovibrionales bacterium]|nr:glycosyltransferase family 2 protein [Bdellovibrionales bacterium]NQZ20053.1 glycosyltransferase family 2 protein [Bdellovibrionales bacterium]
MAALKLVQDSYKYEVSVLIPAYNEEATILFVINSVVKTEFSSNFEIIIVDDGSTDQTQKLIEQYKNKNPQVNLKYFYQENQGKGGAIHTAIQHSEGEILIVQDADMEYTPSDFPALLKPFEDGAQVVYGSRNLNTEDREHSGLLFYWGGILVTIVTNLLYSSKLTDEATGYKVFHAKIFEQFNFKHKDFAWEPEITAKILKKKIKIHEVPITYHPRSKAEGKKITWKDGVKAVLILFLESFKRNDS